MDSAEGADKRVMAAPSSEESRWDGTLSGFNQQERK